MRNFAVISMFACAACAHAASYTSYIGDANSYEVAGIATDASGNTYVTGSRIIKLPTVVTPSPSNPVTDVFVSKVDPAGNVTLIGTYSGKGSDQANGIAVDASGNIYVVGITTSTDFPLRNPLQGTPAQDSIYQGTGFLMKLGPDGAILYSTYLGGTLGPSSMNSVAADAQGNAYVAGWTTATDYPHTLGLPADLVSFTADAVVYGAFFAKVDTTASKIVYAAVVSTGLTCGALCQGATLITRGVSLAVDPAGNAYIAGNGGMQPTPGAFLANGANAFIVKVNAAGTGLTYATYLSAGQSLASAIATDAAGDAYVSGYTSDPAFPATPSALQTKLAGSQNAFVAKLNPTGSTVVWASYLGGSGPDAAQTIAVDPAGNVWASGTTQSANFPRATGTPNGAEFVAELSSSGSALLYSALFPSDTVAAALAGDAAGTVHVAGATGLISAFTPGSGPGQIMSPWAYGIVNAAGGVLAGRLAPGELISFYGLNLGPSTPAIGTFNAAGFLPTTLGSVTVTINGKAAALLYVSGTQINAVAPLELTAGSTVALQIAVNSTMMQNFRARVDAAAPQVFPVAVNQDGTLNSQANPAPVGSYVSIWATGTGYFPGSEGQIQTAANQFCSAVGSCEMFSGIDNLPAVVSYIGAAPGTVNGVVQINFQVTSDTSYYLAVVGSDTTGFSDLFGIYIAP